jgi:hypothetical protein
VEVTWAHSTEHMAVAFICVKNQHSVLSPKVNLCVYYCLARRDKMLFVCAPFRRCFRRQDRRDLASLCLADTFESRSH